MFEMNKDAVYSRVSRKFVQLFSRAKNVSVLEQKLLGPVF